MKITGEWLVLAERVIIDAYNQNLTLVCCLEQIAAASFPAKHAGFAVAALFRCEGAAPVEDVAVRYRLIRCSPEDGDEVVGEYDSVWFEGMPRSRVAINFEHLRLKRAEVVEFRLDHQVQGARWRVGPRCTLDIVQASSLDSEE